MINNKLFRGFTFDGVNSLDYDIYITGESVYNAPVRAVEKVSVPGRNGDLTIDQGRFENVPVTYAKCGCAAKTQEELAEKVSAFRNALCSRVGYKRLTDDYNKDEYRMAMYASGLEVEAIARHRMGTFDIVFDAKPQRFLYAGESPQLLVQNMTPKNPQTESGSLVSIESDGVDAVTSLVAQIEPVQSGSGDPSPDNVRPISGWTECVTSLSPYEQTEKHTITGKNLYNAPNNQNGVLVPCHIENGQTVVASCGGSGVGIRYYNANKTQIDYWTLILQANGRYYRSFTASGGIEYVEFYGAGSTNYMIEVGVNAPSPYEPYGTTHTTSLGRTVYGGTVDVVTGVLTVTHKMHVFDGTETLPFDSVYGGVRFQDAEMNTTQLPIRDFIASTMKGAAARGAGGTPPCIKTYSAATDTLFLFVCMPNATDAESANAWLQAHPTQVVYPITPKTYQLTAQQVELLTGQNHVWADTGNITITWGDDPYMLINPTLHASKPLLKVTGRGTLSVGDVTMTIAGTASQVLYIDCDIMETYSIQDGAMTPQNSLVTIDGYDYPVLLPGATKVTLGSGITRVEVTTRWWRV